MNSKNLLHSIRSIDPRKIKFNTNLIHFISCGKIGIQKEYIWWRKLHHVTVSQVFSLRVKPASVLSCDTAQNVDKMKATA